MKTVCIMDGINLKICPYCHKEYDMSKPHNCVAKKRYNNAYHRQFDEREKRVLKPLHTKRWKLLRKKIIVADGGVCQRCKIKYGILNFNHLEVHHIKPRILYPSLIFDTDNLITVCHTCNAQLGLSGIDFKWSPHDRDLDHGDDYVPFN